MPGAIQSLHSCSSVASHGWRSRNYGWQKYAIFVWCRTMPLQWDTMGVSYFPLALRKKKGGRGRKRRNEGSQFPCRASELREHHQLRRQRNANPTQAHSSQSPWEGADGAEIPRCPTGAHRHLQPKGKALRRGRAGEAPRAEPATPRPQRALPPASEGLTPRPAAIQLTDTTAQKTNKAKAWGLYTAGANRLT